MTKKASGSSSYSSGDVIELKTRSVRSSSETTSGPDASNEHTTQKTTARKQQIAQVLEHRSNFFLDIIRSKVAREIGHDRARVLVIFDAIDEWVQGEFDKPRGFVGCEFIKTVIEVADHNDPVFRAAAKHKAELVALFEQCLEEVSVENAGEVALSLHLFVDGALTQAQIFNDRGSVKRAKALAENLLPELNKPA